VTGRWSLPASWATGNRADEDPTTTATWAASRACWADSTARNNQRRTKVNMWRQNRTRTRERRRAGRAGRRDDAALASTWGLPAATARRARRRENRARRTAGGGAGTTCLGRRPPLPPRDDHNRRGGAASRRLQRRDCRPMGGGDGDELGSRTGGGGER
jgi:hypothetical protein